MLKRELTRYLFLTEDKFFLGRPQYIKTISAEVSLPVLTKDFILDEGQIYEAVFNGASAVLLIVAILEDHQLNS
jgi:indole-3-glycerol phosphate synthase